MLPKSMLGRFKINQHKSKSEVYLEIFVDRYMKYISPEILMQSLTSLVCSYTNSCKVYYFFCSSLYTLGNILISVFFLFFFQNTMMFLSQERWWAGWLYSGYLGFLYNPTLFSVCTKTSVPFYHTFIVYAIKLFDLLGVVLL